MDCITNGTDQGERSSPTLVGTIRRLAALAVWGHMYEKRVKIVNI